VKKSTQKQHGEEKSRTKTGVRGQVGGTVAESAVGLPRGILEVTIMGKK